MHVRLCFASLAVGLALAGCARGVDDPAAFEDVAARGDEPTAVADGGGALPRTKATATVASERSHGAGALTGATARWATWPRAADAGDGGEAAAPPPVVEEPPPPVVEEPPPVIEEPPPPVVEEPPPPVVEEPPPPVIEEPPPADPNAGAGPKPASTCAVSKDAGGFFVRTTAQSSYVAYVPASYDGSAPVRLIVGLHGCGDSAMNFATWGVNPYPTRATQGHIGISIGGRDGACWSLGTDDAKVLAAVDDIATCFWVHQKKVTIAGFSSGGLLAYRVGLMRADRFAGILIENSGLYATGASADTWLTNASWRVNVAHRAHTGDTVFPLAKVRADWTKITAASFPLVTSETVGGHDGTSDDWAFWLIPQSTSWTAP